MFKLPQFITAFFEKFHPSFPAIHRPTFDAAVAKEPLLQAVACIGALYTSPGSNSSISLALFEAGLKSLDKYVTLAVLVMKMYCRPNMPSQVREDRSRFREIWVTQAYTLFCYFAMYCCRDDIFPTAVRIQRRIVDAARQYQLLQDKVLLGGCGSGMSPDQGGTPPDGFLANSSSPEHAWQRFIENETRKRYEE